MKTIVKFGLSVSAIAGLMSANVYASPANQKGVTWGKTGHDIGRGVDSVGCKTSDGYKCDPYKGDMTCSTALPILCMNKSGAKLPQGLDNSNRYKKWSAGHIAHTYPIKGSDIGSASEANQICENLLGKGWRLADHHDGWGWNFTAYGNIRDDTRYWVNVKNQKNGHCW